jgi:glycosyltransferase involved in cell wall biosynthesis
MGATGRDIHAAGPVRVIALVPARDESSTVAETVRALLEIPAVERVVVIDDGSSDVTGTRAREAGAEVVRLPASQGKGEALNAGLATVIEDPFDVLLVADADLRDSAHGMAELIGLIVRADADVAIAGMRPRGRAGGFGLVKGLARSAIRRRGGAEMRAPLSGQRALSRAALETIGSFAGGYGVEIDMTLRALRAGLKVVELDTGMEFSPTHNDPAGVIHRARQFLAVLGVVLRDR